LADAVGELTGGVGPDVTAAAAGSPETLDAAFRRVRPVGTVSVCGVQGDDLVPVAPRLWRDPQATLLPTTEARRGDPTPHLQQRVALKARGQVDPGRLVTHRRGFDANDVTTAYQMSEPRLEHVIQVVMDVGASPMATTSVTAGGRSVDARVLHDCRDPPTRVTPTHDLPPASSLAVGVRSGSVPLTGSASRRTDSEPSLLRKLAPRRTQRPLWSALAPAMMA
jgi:hypothetical protein